MLFKDVHEFYTKLITELDKEGQAAIAVARADLGRLGDAVKSGVMAEEKAILAQYASVQPEIQAAVQATIQSLEQAIVAALKAYGL